MSAEIFHLVKGNPTNSSFTNDKARSTLEFIEGEHSPWVTVVEQREASDADTLVVDVEVELPQYPLNGIYKVERIALKFHKDDIFSPEVLALRKDFPEVPHMNMTREGEPRSLCLEDQPYEDQKLRWTPAWFLNRLRSWLSLTARGELHKPNQRLEPLLAPSLEAIVLPHTLFSLEGEKGEASLEITYTLDSNNVPTFLTRKQNALYHKDDKLKAIALVFRGEAQEHGVIKHQPKNLLDLHGFLEGAGLDFISILRKQIRDWVEDPTALKSRLIIIPQLPKTRSNSDEIESVDVWAFLTSQTVEEIGLSLDVLERYEGTIGLLIGETGAAQNAGGDIQIGSLNPVSDLTRDAAARFNGLPCANNVRVFCVGAGALGSQVMTNLTKAGFGIWSVVDKDRLLPHNVARHALFGEAVGMSKADGVAYLANTSFSNEQVITPIVADFLRPGAKSKEIADVISTADLILDMSASIPVARTLACDSRSVARRVSLFLNPSGTDSVMLLEDSDRSLKLDHLEMQYYRFLLETDDLEDHLLITDETVRYGLSCRDLSAKIPQDLVALHAALGARALKKNLSDDVAKIIVWQAKEDLSVEVYSVTLSPSYTQTFDKWQLIWDEMLEQKVKSLRAKKLPNETGGILIGSFDTERCIVYVVDVIPSPPDSGEYPAIYERGIEGLASAFDETKNRTASMLEYVGEWHSHPDGHNCQPSEQDRQLYSWISEHMRADGLPPLMLIAGEDALCWYLNGL